MVAALIAGGLSSSQPLGFFSPKPHISSVLASSAYVAPVQTSFKLLDEAQLTPEAEVGISALPAPEPEPTYIPIGAEIDALVTHYGESFNGRILGCGNGYYSSDNPTIVAVGPSRHSELPCGTPLKVCGSAGCQVVVRQDACPGCGSHLFDLSEAAIERVCGVNASVCEVSVVKLELTPTP